MSLKSFVIGICIFFTGGVFGAFIILNFFGDIKKNFQLRLDSVQVVDKTSLTYQAGFNDAKKLVEESSLGSFFKIQDDVRSVSGIVTAIDGNRITIHDESMSNPFDESNASDKIVVIDTNTKVSKFVREETKTPTVETNASSKTLQTLRVVTVQVTSSDIVIGNSVTVTTGQNIKDLSEFTAQEIQILPAVSKK